MKPLLLESERAFHPAKDLIQICEIDALSKAPVCSDGETDVSRLTNTYDLPLV